MKTFEATDPVVFKIKFFELSAVLKAVHLGNEVAI